MKNELIMFTNENFGQVRMVEVDGKPYAVATDIAKALGYEKPNNAINTHCRATLKQGITDSSGRIQEMNIISQGDIVRLIVKSKLPMAEKFESWIFDDVIPEVLKTGSYIVDDKQAETIAVGKVMRNADGDMLEMIANMAMRQKELFDQNQIMQPKAEYYDKVLSSESEITTSQIAKDCFMSAKQLNLILSHAKVQYKQNGQWLLYADYQNKGYTKTRTKAYLDSNRVQQTKHYTVWTEKGREFILDLVDDL